MTHADCLANKTFILILQLPHRSQYPPLPPLNTPEANRIQKCLYLYWPHCQQPLQFPALSWNSHTHCTQFSSLGQEEWEGEGLFLLGFKRYNSPALTRTYSLFLPSGHLLFLLLPAPSQTFVFLWHPGDQKPAWCAMAPALGSLAWWWVNSLY